MSKSWEGMRSSDRRRRRRAVDGEQLLALGARRAKTRRAKEDGVGAAAVVFTANGVVAAPTVAFAYAAHAAA